MITIEKIDYVMNSTHSSYEVVKKALLETDGDVDEAIKIIKNSSIMVIENESNENFTQSDDEDKITFDDILDAIKEIWAKGNASKLSIEKNGEIVLNLSLTVSAIGVILAPVAAVIGIGLFLIDDYEFKITLDTGEIINVKSYIKQKMR